MFEASRHTRNKPTCKTNKGLLDFLYLHAQAAEASGSDKKPSKSTLQSPNVNKTLKGTTNKQVIITPLQHVRKSEKNPLIACSNFRSTLHDDMIALLKTNGN